MEDPDGAPRRWEWPRAGVLPDSLRLARIVEGKTSWESPAPLRQLGGWSLDRGRFRPLNSRKFPVVRSTPVQPTQPRPGPSSLPGRPKRSFSDGQARIEKNRPKRPATGARAKAGGESLLPTRLARTAASTLGAMDPQATGKEPPLDPPMLVRGLKTGTRSSADPQSHPGAHART